MKIVDILQPWQLRYFRAFLGQKRMISLCSRQIGKSFISAFCAVYDAVMNGGSWTLVSTGQRAADELFRKCVQMTKYYQGMLKGTKLAFGYSANMSEIRFSNGSVIASCPNNPDGLRGRSSSLLFDEFAFVENADECFQACIPFLTSPYGAEKKLQIISTPGGCSGRFYELWEKSDYYKTKVTLLDAVNEGLKVDVDEIKRTCMDDDIFRQEYLCEFLDGSTSLFGYDLLRGQVKVSTDPGDIYIGIDIGRTHDRTAIAFLHRSDAFYVDHVEILRDKEFDEQFAYICRAIDQSKARRVSVDATGIGMNIAENLRKKYGSARIDAVTINHGTKNELFGDLKQALGSGEIFLPSDETVITDLHQIKRIVSPSGQISFSAGRDEHGHADIATSVALALRAAKTRKTSFMPFAVRADARG